VAADATADPRTAPSLFFRVHDPGMPEMADPSKVARRDRPQGTLIDIPTQPGRDYTLKSV
jgi:hypothetical protein